MRDYKDTLFLPQTAFAMKGNLKSLEPQLIQEWHEQDLYRQLQQDSQGKPSFVLHWGPPYANGHLHIGHALNGILKDMTCRIHRLKGYRAPLVPGWDCHGLPIEWKVEENYRAQKKHKDNVPIIEFRQECRAYARHWITIQNQEFQRLGILYDSQNPYITMDFESEGLITQTILECLEQGIIYKGVRPIMWSVIEKTALAEAEIEYIDKESTSLYVRFPIQASDKTELMGAYALIWTTTPWTLPGNRAIAYGSDITYCLVSVASTRYLIAQDLIDSVSAALSWENVKIIDQFNGHDLKSTIASHPLHDQGYTFDVPFVCGDHVTTSAGTGLVHIAPGHGVEDFAIGKAYHLDVPETLNGEGVYYDHIPLFAGLHVYKADPLVLEALSQSSNLVHAHKIVHSYPHSWRSKKPLIYRTTPQWFIAMDNHTGIRRKALDKIKAVEWTPRSGQNRITSMVENRPDWCISRQRSWGVPIPIFISKKTGEPLCDRTVNHRIIESIRKNGCDIWFQDNPQQFLGNDYNPDDFEVVRDVIDVWFESGATQHFVLEQRPDLTYPADLYLEGSDQHRGWFQSSLLIGCATRDQAPFKKVITHGFTVDERGRKMSKSLGNTLSLEQAIDDFGAEIVRLWVASCDYTDDLRISANLLKNQQDIYRRYRNTLRYLLGALSNTAINHDLSYDALPTLEKWVLHHVSRLSQQFNHLLTTFDYQKFYADLHHFCSSDLSAFYFDIRKDCLYCDSVDSIKRQQTLFTMAHVFEFLARVLSPVLCFTTEEAWTHYGQSQNSIHLTRLDDLPAYFNNQEVYDQFEKQRDLRRLVTAALEQARTDGIIRSSLQAQVILGDPEKIIDEADTFAELCIVSALTIASDFQGDAIVVSSAVGEKCERCWKILPTIGANVDHPQACERCADAVVKGSNDSDH